jgi:hypothetical protein
LILGLTSPGELKEMAIENISAESRKSTEYSKVDKDILINHFETILQVDPYMYCWTNFHLSYLYSHWNVVGENHIASWTIRNKDFALGLGILSSSSFVARFPFFPTCFPLHTFIV